MSAITTDTAAAGAVAGASPRVSPVGTFRAFRALLWRDVFVTGRELGTFVAQVVIQPLFMLFVFGKVLTQLGYASGGFAHLLLPGIVALTSFITGLQATALPLVIDFSFTKEIEDRLLAPLPTVLVAVEKIVFATLRAVVAGAIMYPIGLVVLGSAGWQLSGLALMALMLVLGAMVGSSVGLVLGTLLPPSKINIMFAVILTPLLFTGATQYPWPSLDRLPWFKVVTAFNPLTYVSEGMRAAVVPDVPHMHWWVCVPVLLGYFAVLATIGIRGFMRRAID
jgi:ABC-2 type transport system permease protein